MKTIQFKTWDKGLSGNKIITVNIPEKCEHGYKHTVSKDLNQGKSLFQDSCPRSCFSSYETIWKIRVGIVIDGETCAWCSEFYPMAVANQSDGSLKCYSCRTTNALKKMLVG